MTNISIYLSGCEVGNVISISSRSLRGWPTLPSHFSVQFPSFFPNSPSLSPMPFHPSHALITEIQLGKWGALWTPSARSGAALAPKWRLISLQPKNLNVCQKLSEYPEYTVSMPTAQTDGRQTVTLCLPLLYAIYGIQYFTNIARRAVRLR